MSEIIISSGVTSTGLVAESGDIIIIEDGGTLVDGTIQDGGVLSATFGAALEDLTAEAGATVELTGTAKTSGAILRGANTNIAEGTLYYMGSAVTGTVVDGTLSNLSGAYRICVGDGITVSDPTVGGEATVKDRVYALETAVVSGGSVTTNGNIGLQEGAYGNEVTVGGNGITAATYNLFDSATADNTTVNEGGTLRLNSAGNTANHTVVNSGGTVRFDAGAGADVLVNSSGVMSAASGVTLNGVTQSGGNIYVYDGAVVNDLNVYAFTAGETPCFYLSGGTAIGGSAVGNDVGGVEGQVVGTGVLSNYVLTTSQTSFANDNRTWVWVGGHDMAGGGLAKDVTVNNRARLQVQGIGASAANINVVSGGSLWVFNSAVVNDVLVSGLLGTVSAQITAGYSDDTYGKGVLVKRATVDRGGLFEVSKGATVEDVTVLSTGRMNVRAGGYVSGATVSANGRLDVWASLDTATVKDGGFLVAWKGTIRDVQVSGASGATKARLSALQGGTVDNVDVYTGGIVDVGKDGSATARNVRVHSGGELLFYQGTGYDIDVRSNGSMNLRNGVVVSGANVASGGIANVSSGAILNLSGTDVASGVNLLASARMVVSTGATAVDLSVSGNVGVGAGSFWNLNVNGGKVSGGAATGAAATNALCIKAVNGGEIDDFTFTAADATNQTIWGFIGYNGEGAGSASNITVEKRCRLDARNGGVVSGATVQNGAYLCIWGGSAYDVKASGIQDGVKTRISALYMGTTKGVIERAEIGSGAALEIGNGGYASQIDVKTSGGIAVLAGGSADNVNVSGDVQLDGNNPFYALNVNGGKVSGGAAIGYNDKKYAVFVQVAGGGTLEDYTFTAESATDGQRVWAIVTGTGVGSKLTVESRCMLDARNGGVISGATVTDGALLDVRGGIAYDVKASGILQNVKARVSARQIGNYQGVVSRAEIGSGGYLEVLSGGYASKVDVGTGGYMKVLSGGSADDVNVTMAGASDFYLVVDGGTVSGGTMTETGDTYGGTYLQVIKGGYLRDYTFTAENATGPYRVCAYIGWNGTAAGSAANLTVEKRCRLDARQGGVISGATVLAGAEMVLWGGSAYDVVASGLYNDLYWCHINVISRTSDGGLLERATIGSGAHMEVGDGGIASSIDVTGDVTLNSGGVLRDVVQHDGLVQVYAGAALFNAELIDGDIYLFDTPEQTGVERAAMTAENVTVSGGRYFLRGTNVSGSDVTMHGGILYVQNGAVARNINISGGTIDVRQQSNSQCVDYDVTRAAAENVDVLSGGSVHLESGGFITSGTLHAGASMTVYKGAGADVVSVESGAAIDISFYDVAGGHGNDDAIITGWDNLQAGVEVNVHSIETGYDYVIGDAANADVTLDCGNYRIFDEAVKSGEQHSNAFLGRNLDFTDGKTLKVGTITVGSQGTAATLDGNNATVLADGGLATKWTSTTDVTTLPAAVAGADTTGDAWLTVDGANLTTALYGAEGNFNHDVNLWLYEGTVRNLAAGATAGGSVKNVNLLVSDNGEGTDKLTFEGTAYLGGFGSVTGEVTAAVYGGSYDKDFYAGALANKLSAQTSVGGVNLTVTGGLFKGNLYGASAVKTVEGTGSGIRNTTGDVNLTIAGGEADKSDFCAFAGGYATGTATGTVYTVDSVTATISGGDWGSAHGGRGVFGGIMASGVEAQVLGEVNLTVSGGTMGNVYGGGWAQKGGASIVGKVNISIAGGTITNVFGGGTTSTSGGTTTAGAVTITVSGGNITGSIYARGQGQYDSTGAAGVIFSGANDFTCGVYGYSRVPENAGDGEETGAALSFTGYTGTFGGKIGGFDGITFDGATAMELTTATADVSNGAWEFDLTDRANTLAGTSLLTWSGANFENDTIKVSFADDTQAQGGWNIATVAEAFSGTTFDLEIGGSEIATGLNYSQQISDGDYQGWGFELESGVLKFKNLA